MLRTDTGNFNRFLTSLGLLLLAAALIIPYFYFRNTDILTISSSDLSTMTDQGRSAIVGRQHAISDLEPWVIVAATLLAVTGSVLLVAGGLRLKVAQESEDEETELRKDRARLEMGSLSAEERDEKALEKAREGGAEKPEDEPAVSGPEKTPADTAEARAKQRISPSALRAPLQKRQLAVARIENGIEDAFKESTLATHRLKPQVKISSPTDAIQLDGLFEAFDEDMPDVVLKTRVAFNPDTISRGARLIANELVAELSRYRAMTRRSADGWLVTVLPVELEEGVDKKTTETARQALDSALGTFGSAAVVLEAELEWLPRLFATHFGHTYLL